MAQLRLRRVLVKTHIARAGRTVGAGAFSKHLTYIQRDGVDRDGTSGALYGRERDEMDGSAFDTRSQKDRHQFRIIVSPEDEALRGDLKSFTRDLMDQMERDLGTRLDWVAVDHHNTGHSHTHIVVRGKDKMGRDLVISPAYLNGGLRGRAQAILTRDLGPRRDLEIARSQRRDVDAERYTSLDRGLEALQQDRRIEIVPGKSSSDRFKRRLYVQRLRQLEKMRLAERAGASAWHLEAGWTETLKAMGKRGDIIQALGAGLRPGEALGSVRFFEERRAKDAPLLGIVYRQGPEDELKDTRFLLIKDFTGDLWHVATEEDDAGGAPPRGAIVSITKQEGRAKPADWTIAGIAERSSGLYSDARHGEIDPSASASYRLAHKRRLEALRRAGLVDRLPDGRWAIGEDFLERAGAFEAARATARIDVRSWIDLETQIKHRGDVWLDRLEDDGLSEPRAAGFDAARRARRAFLREAGHLSPDETRLSADTRQALREAELRAAKESEARRSGRQPADLANGESFEGRYERIVDLGQGRFSVVGDAKAFVLVPWRAGMERHRGRALIVEARARGLGWTVPGTRRRDLSR